MSLRRHRGPKAVGSYRGASQKMCRIPPHLRYKTKVCLLSFCAVSVVCVASMHTIGSSFVSGTGWTEPGGERVWHRDISQPGGSLQSSISAPAQCWVLRKLCRSHDDAPFGFTVHRKYNRWSFMAASLVHGISQCLLKQTLKQAGKDWCWMVAGQS